LLNEFLKEHRQAEEQEHKLAAQDSRLQQNATIRPAKSVAAEQWKETKASVDTSTMESIAKSLLHEVALVALCRGWPETLPLAALAKLPEPIDTDEPVTAWLFASKAYAELFRGAAIWNRGNARATSNRSGMSEAGFRCCSKGHRARYLDCPRQIARTIDAHRPGIWHLDSNQLRAARESSRVICQLAFDVLANACTPVEFALREALLTRY
jgi:hypothetical protein